MSHPKSLADTGKLLVLLIMGQGRPLSHWALSKTNLELELLWQRHILLFYRLLGSTATCSGVFLMKLCSHKNYFRTKFPTSAPMKERLLTVYGCTNLAENTCRLSSIRSFPTVLRCSTRWACSWVLGTVGHTWTPPPASPNGWPWGWMSWPSGRGVEDIATTDLPARASRTVPNHPRNPATSERTTQKKQACLLFLTIWITSIVDL